MPVATENKREIFIFENYLMFKKLFVINQTDKFW